GKPLTNDLFSFTCFGEPWLSHSWLTDLWLYISFLLGSFPGITIWIAALTMLTAVMVFFQMEGPPVYRMVLTIAMSVLLLPFLKARPQMISIIFFLVTIRILSLYRTRKRDLLIWLIPGFFLWANLHGGFVIGFIVIFITLIVDNLARVVNTDKEVHFERNQNIRLIIVVLLCSIVVMIHPLGIRVWTTLSHTLGVGGEQAEIMEWASPDFHDPRQLIYLVFVIAVWITLSISPRKAAWIEIILFSILCAMGFIWRRNLVFLVLYGMIIVSGHLWITIETAFCRMQPKIKKYIPKVLDRIFVDLGSSTPRVMKAVLLLIVSLVFIAAELKLYVITDHQAIEYWEDNLFPMAARTWIEQNDPQGNMLNSYNWGGYFEWYLKDYPVYIDSRADLFGDQIIGEWLNVMYAEEGWQEILDFWSINLIVIEPGWKIADLLPFYGWHEYYHDDQAVIFGRAPYNSVK
ncbi:MAG: hypothetical protein JXR32_05410, partial [Anaerolineaceae bacterium]|nr:hypothetical protein [Anaerolineaceae bacterium]